MLGPRRSMVATVQDTPAQVEQSLPLRTLTSWDEAHAKHAEIAENGTVKVCVTNTIGIDVEEGRMTIKAHGDEDKSRYMSGPKLIFLLLCVYHKSTALLVVPTQPSGACFSLYFLVRRVPLGSMCSNATLTYNSGTRPEHRCDSFTSSSKLLQLSGLGNMDRLCILLDSKCQAPLQASLGHLCH